jgi:hypothetical protein
MFASSVAILLSSHYHHRDVFFDSLQDLELALFQDDKEEPFEDYQFQLVPVYVNSVIDKGTKRKRIANVIWYADGRWVLKTVARGTTDIPLFSTTDYEVYFEKDPWDTDGKRYRTSSPTAPRPAAR